jgi:hypothetical protein
LGEWWTRIFGQRTSSTDSDLAVIAIPDERSYGEVKPVLRESGG